MEVILLKDIEHLGKEGDIVKVKPGYGRNYLLPRKLALLSSQEAVKALEDRRKKKKAGEEKIKKAAEANADKITALSPTITVEAGVDDKIFGTVTPEMVRNSLRQEGIEIDKRDVLIEEPIKKLGVYQVRIKLHPEVEASLRVWIVKK